MRRSTTNSLCGFLAVVLFASLAGNALAKDPEKQKCGDGSKPKEQEILPLGDAGNPEDLYVQGDCLIQAEGTYHYGKVTIFDQGTLTFSQANIELRAASIVIQDGGAMIAGTEAVPIGSQNLAHHVVIRFVGDKPADPVAQPDNCSAVDKGIAVMKGGTLELYGAKGVPRRGGVSWTYLSAPAGPSAYEATNKNIGAVVKNGEGGRRIELARSVGDGTFAWKPGDWIVIATTSYSPFESEFAQIESISGTTVLLKTPLKYYHFGGSDPGPAADPSAPWGAGLASASFSAGKDRNYGVDERAEVGLISRNIVLAADTTDAITSSEDPSRNWGGETKFCQGFKRVVLEGVEISKFGKEFLGSYPIHVHMAGDVKGKLVVDANSVHHSYNKCMTIHMSQNATFANNVCARITGHIFYQEMGDEAGTTFVNNLAVGAMNNNFGLPAGSSPTATKGFWEGDNLAAGLGYTGLGIRNTDNQSAPVHGSCYSVDPNTGLLVNAAGVSCDPKTQYYTEPPTAFWIINPSAVLEGNSVAGCQGQGRGYWYVPAVTPVTLRHTPVGRFRNNRVHGCYDGIFGEPEGAITTSTQLFPTDDGTAAGANLIARFEGFTATRIRNRAVWMRPMWNVFENARVATSREGVALVTSGGLDGNGPGVWGLLRHAVVVGVSTNNVDRWGPCGDKGNLSPGSTQEFVGCVDANKNSKEITGKYYPGPGWNFAGFYIYDGPVRIHDTRFVRYQVNPTALLTTDDAAIMDRVMPRTSKPYEGDAALGWFAANPSAYPTATEVKNLQFEETSLRHQIFTDKVNLSSFLDGDKNTAVIDRDGTLTGFRVIDKDGNEVKGFHPISLNNLPFNATSNAVDECLSEGAQDAIQEGRPTSLISPGSMASLEFGALQLPDGYTTDSNGQVSNQEMTFTRDSPDHASMALSGRNSQGIWEPKVASGHGYTIRASLGIPRIIDIGLTDAVKPKMDVDPFYVRVGVCYSGTKGIPKTPKFQIYRGYKSWGGNGTNYNDLTMRKSFNYLNNLYKDQLCYNLDAQNRGANLGENACPADGVVYTGGACPTGSIADKDKFNNPVCIFKSSELQPGSFTQLTKDGKPDPTVYHYDDQTGMLFFWMTQNDVNAAASSPIGTCIKGTDSACPPADDGLFGCPPQGCSTYTVEIVDPEYTPGPSSCGGNTNTGIYTKAPQYVLPEPADANQLAYTKPFPEGVDPKGKGIVTAISKTSTQGFAHKVASVPPVCTGTP